jgi:hypothetical protein
MIWLNWKRESTQGMTSELKKSLGQPREEEKTIENLEEAEPELMNTP